MPRIEQLPEDVVTKISAGEVIERPASVVKELLENAIDAGSRRIDIELEQGGAELIRVVDDGCGIEPDELALAVSRHATSKLRTAEELYSVRTLGFRGEALASIASVSRLTIQSRPAGWEHGAEIRCEAGQCTPPRDWAGAPGTRIEVRQLFFNVPVRRKFLKSTASELGQVSEALIRIAMAYPAVHLSLKHHGRLLHDLPPCRSTRERIGLLFGNEIADALTEVQSASRGLRLGGCVAQPGCHRGNAKLQYFFVNGRWFRDRSLQFALMEAYRNFLMSGRYPIGFLFLDVPPDEVDVNVHPTKAEVKFRQPQLVFSLIRNTVMEGLLKCQQPPLGKLPARPIAPPEMAPIPSLFLPATGRDTATVPPMAERGTSTSFASSAAWSLAASPESSSPASPASSSAAGPAWGSSAAISARPTTDPLRGAAVQIHNAYIIEETPDGMLVIDQHALHERILFEQMRRRVLAGTLEVQRLLIPEPVELPLAHAAAVLDAADALAQLGMEVSDFGGGTVLLASYPVLLGRRPPRELFLGVVDELVSRELPPPRDVLLNQLLATMACKAAVKAGDRLTPEEIQYLLELRDLAEASHHCPHGRPTTLRFSRQDLDRQFCRT